VDGDWYISSADWMYRNLNNRVEAACPVKDRAARARLQRIIDVMLADHRKAWELLPDGRYVARTPPPGAPADSPAVEGTFATLMRERWGDEDPRRRRAGATPDGRQATQQQPALDEYPRGQQRHDPPGVHVGALDRPRIRRWTLPFHRPWSGPGSGGVGAAPGVPGAKPGDPGFALAGRGHENPLGLRGVLAARALARALGGLEKVGAVLARHVQRECARLPCRCARQSGRATRRAACRVGEEPRGAAGEACSASVATSPTTASTCFILRPLMPS